MQVWNKPPQPSKPVLPKETYRQAELYRYKLQLEDEVKASPLSELTKQFYEQMTRPLVNKEPEIPP